ncbi:MAG: translation initiation factor IF-2 N-terminal domain-containing protein, partial [Acutalibacter sp.]|nr:translation initiation factor IF-2 N-terminal domain-containing protein [Acutalibacter sp.]
MMIKYRVREVAKDLGIQNKEVIDTLAKFFPEPKKYMTALNENELDIVLESFTQQRSMESFDAFFAQRDAVVVRPEPQSEPMPEVQKAQPEQEKSAGRKQPEEARTGRKPQEQRPGQRQDQKQRQQERPRKNETRPAGQPQPPQAQKPQQ